MRKVRNVVLSACLMMALAVFQLACGGGGGSSTVGGGSSCAGGNSSGTQGTVDLAVGDDEGDATNDLVHIFFDILNQSDTNPNSGNTTGPDIEPDLTLDNDGGSGAGNAIDTPDNVLLTSGATAGGGDLYVDNSGWSEIDIWRDYRNIPSNIDADVMLDNSGGFGFSNITDMVYDANDNLIIADDGNDMIFIYNDANALTGDGTEDADVQIYADGACVGFTECINDPESIFVTTDEGTGNEDLYVANGSVAADGDPVVAIFRDVNSIAADVDPDANLTEDSSFLDLGFVGHDVWVHNDVLYVSADEDDESAQIFVFMDASALTTDALPDAVLYGPAARLDEPVAMVVVDVAGNTSTDTLFVANANGELTFDPVSGLIGFIDADTLATGQQADIALVPYTSNISSTFDVQEAGGALFVAGYRSEDGDFNSDDAAQIAIFRNIGLYQLCGDSVSNIVLSSTGIPMPSNEFGPFGNVADLHGMFAIEVDSST